MFKVVNNFFQKKLIAKWVTQIYHCLFFCLVFSSSNLRSQSLEDGLLIYYSWDSTFLDQSDNEFDPYFVNATFIEDRHGKSSKALYFNGIDEYITLPNSNDLLPPFPLSFSFWFKLDDLTPEHGVLFDNDFNEFTHSGVMMNISSSQRLGIAFGNGQGFYLSARKTFLTDIHLEAERWYYATGVFHNRFDMRIFINGEEQNGLLDGSAENMVYVEGVGNIGRQDANYQLLPYHFKGFMDEFRYWNRGLSNDEVRLLYEEETLSVNEVDGHTVRIFPNPVNDLLNITTNSSDNPNIRIFNQYSKLIIAKLNTKQLRTNFLSSGIYILEIEQIDTGLKERIKLLKH